MSFESHKWSENAPEVISEGLKFKNFLEVLFCPPLSIFLNETLLGPKPYDRICLCIICTCMSVCTHPRHSRFGGTFVVANQKSIAGTERVYHRPIAGRTQGSGWEGESSTGQWGPNPVHRTVLINISWDNYLRRNKIMSWQGKWEKHELP